MKSPATPSNPVVILGSAVIHDAFAKEGIDGLMNGFEHIGVTCINKNGKITKTEKIESVGNEGEARSIKTMEELADTCGEDTSIWWHTHASTLSSMSVEDRLTAGNLKLVANGDVMCAIGIEGYSCHSLKNSPPTVFTKHWNGNFFDMLKKSPIVVKTGNIDKKWKIENVLEGVANHMTCSTINGVIACLGIDWDKGIAHFPIGAYHQVVVTGNTDISPEENGFSLLASPADEKLNCISIVSGTGNDGRRVLYCK